MTGGSITFRGENFTPSPPTSASARPGPVAGGPADLTNLTVEENLRLGGFLYTGDRAEKDMANAFDMFPVLKERRNLAAGGLSGGEQQMLAIARALWAGPAACSSTSRRWGWRRS